MHMSSFQRYRQQERENALARGDFLSDDESPIDLTGLGIATDDIPARSPASYKRPGSDESAANTSTPTTSIASPEPFSPTTQVAPQKQPPIQLERSLTKRRLYEQGLDQHMYEQQASNLTRLNSIQRQRTHVGGKSPISGLQPKASIDLQERPNINASPPVQPLTTFGSIRKPSSNTSSPPTSHPQSPTLPLNEYEDFGVLSSTIQPSDRGKATAMGAFDKPRQAFDEDQYLKRLQQMQQGTSLPHPALQASSSTTASPKVSEESDRSVKLARFDSARHTPDSTTQQRRRSRSSPAKPEQSQAFSVFQQAAAANRAVHEGSPQLSAAPTMPNIAPAVPDTHRTFFGDISASDDDDDESVASDYERRGYGYGSGRFPSTLASVSEHPAMRSQTSAFPEIREEDEEDVLPSPEHAQDSSDTNVSSDSESAMPPSTAPRSDLLRGLVHQHLRKQSDQSSIAPSIFPPQHLRNQSTHSSIYPATVGKEDSAASLTSNVPGFGRHTYNENRIGSTYTNSNPWDLDDFDSSYYYGENEVENQDTTGNDRSATPHGNEPSKTVDEPEPIAWQHDLKSQHTRDSSNGTMQEREAFANELAARQKAIQENLRSIVEADSRSGSPQPTSSGAFKAFNMLKPKSSRDSMVRQDASSKASKLLGLGSAGGSTSALGRYEEDSRPGAERQSSFSSVSRGLNSQRAPQMTRTRENSETSLRGRLPQSQQSPTINETHARSRSNSAASSIRAPSRQGRFRDDPSQAGTARSPKLPQHMSSQTSLNGFGQPSPSDIQSRLRSGSRSNTPGIPEAPQDYPTQHANNGRNGPMPLSGPASAPNTAGLRTGPAAPPRPSPVGSSFSSGAITPLSATSAPSSYGNFSRPAPMTARSGGQLLRKKTVSKAEISEPTLISSTSTVDTVDLPPGASLKNGMDEIRAPAPPRRSRTQKLFNFGRDSPTPSEDFASKRANAVSPPPSAPLAYGQTRNPERSGFQHANSSFNRPQPRTMRSDESLDRPLMPNIAVPERPVMTEGGMF